MYVLPCSSMSMFYRCAVGVTPSVCSGPCRGRRRLKLQRPATRTLWTIRTQHLSDIRSDWTTITTISSLDCTDNVITDQARRWEDEKMRRWEDEKMRLIRVEIVEKLSTTLDETQEDAEAMHPASPSSYQSPSSVGWVFLCGFNEFQWSIIHRFGLWENLQESPIFGGKKMVKTMVSG